MSLRVSITMKESIDEVWAVVSDIADHVNWMQDAAEIRFLTEQRSGVGTRFECDTVVGPLKTTDIMEITRWKPGRSIGVRHEGAVTGSGVFLIEPNASGGTTFTWAEHLTFPIWMGGPVGAAAATPILTLIWRRNLKTLADRVTQRSSASKV